MKIGMLSDTHGNLAATKKAALALRKAGVDAVFHCGDIGGMDVLSELAAVFEPIGVPVHAVLGNVDVHSSDWKYFPSNVGIHLHGRFADFRLESVRIAVIHGDDHRRYNQTVSCREYDLVLSGHTHAVRDVRAGPTRCINPGSAGRGAPDTCAVLDLKSGNFKALTL